MERVEIPSARAERETVSEIVKLEKYCLCGNSMQCELSSPKYAEKVEQIWNQVHNGEGHGDTDKATCEKAEREKRDE